MSYYLTLWSNANTENYKADGGTPPATPSLSGTVAPGASFLVSRSDAVLPSYATADQEAPGVINFNGDDSVVLYSTNTWDVANIVDAIGFTDAGAEGTN